MSETPEYIPISYLNAYAYCPRRFYYEFTLGEMVVNEFVLEGQILHERVDTPGRTGREDHWQLRRVYLCVPGLGLSGYCDVVEIMRDREVEEVKEKRPEDDDLPGLARAGRLYPVEYKKGKLGQWISDHVQLCAQALALEEGLGVEPGTIKGGYVFYYGSARREEVALDAALRERTLALIGEARRVATASVPPPPINNQRKCRDCSLEEICLPREVRTFAARISRAKAKTDLNEQD